MDRDRDVNLPRTNVEAPRADVGTEPDLRRSMIMGRGLDTTANVRDVDLPFVRNEQISPMAGDEMRWGSIWGGFLTYFALTMIFGALAVAIGALAINPATPGTVPGLAATAGIVTAIILLLSTFIGGLVTGWTANLRTGWGTILNGLVLGSVVLSLPLLLAVVALAIGSAVGSGVAAGQAAAAAGAQLQLPGAPVTTLDAATFQVVGSNVGWFSLGGLLVLGAAILGCWLGMRAHLNQVTKNPIAGGIAVSEYNRHLREDLLRREERGRQEVGYGRDVTR